MFLKEKAYAAALKSAALLSGGGKPLSPAVERTQPPLRRSPLYNDSFYFNFFDARTAIGGFTWIGKLHNARMVNSVQVLYGLGEDVLVKFGAAPYPEFNTRLECGGIQYQAVEPFKHWRIKSSGPMMLLREGSRECDPESFFGVENTGEMLDADLELEFKALGPPHNSKDYCAPFLASQMVRKGFGLKDLAGVRKIAANHYEQSGTCTGAVSLGGQRVLLEAFGHRDHSWGIRDWSAPSGWTWLSVQFGADVALNLCRVVIGKVDLFMGHVLREGRNFPLRDCRLETVFEQDGHTQKSISFFLEDVGGFVMEAAGRPLKLARLVRDDGAHRVVVNEALTRYSWGKREANGISEYLHKVR